VRQGCNRRECGIDRLVWRETLAETYRKGTGVERIECGHAINNDEPVSVELQLHQQLFAEGVDEVGGVGSASHMADLDTCAGDLGQVHIRATGYQSWQSVFDGAQRFQHLPGQEELGPPLCLAYGQQSPIHFSGLCCPNRVRHSCAASPDRSWLPNGAFVGRLVFHLRIELGAK
jgi:hypothetical protein